MILAFDIKPESLKSPATFSREMFSASLKEGILIRPIGHTVYVMPPYIFSTEETMQMGAAVQRALNRVLA
jgi:adenosylmethionine-8-amino-7-oxononanoate aminotransferase